MSYGYSGPQQPPAQQMGGDGDGAAAAGAAAHQPKAGVEFEIDESQPRTLYVGNLPYGCTEELIITLFSQIGQITKSKFMLEGQMEPYAFVEFADHNVAAQALVAMNKRVLLEKEMKVNWATHTAKTNNSGPKIDTSKHYHVFVGDLSPEIDNKSLRDAFCPYGDISDAKVIKDTQTLKSKGYGFVSFVTKEEAEKAIEGMNGQWLGRRTIRTNWASRKPGGVPVKAQSYEEVYNATVGHNTTVYVGNTPNNLTERDLHEAFQRYGKVQEVRLFKAQGYAFVRLESKESATNAIVNLNGAEIAGGMIRCSWGRSQSAQQDGGQMDQRRPDQQQQYPQHQQQGYGSYNPGWQQQQQQQQQQYGGMAAPMPPNTPMTQQQQWQQWQQWQQYYANPQACYYQQQQQQPQQPQQQ